jgi:hypothetical protein
VTNPFVKAVDIFSNTDNTRLPASSNPKRATSSPVRHNESLQHLIPKSPDPAQIHTMQLLSKFIDVYFPNGARAPAGTGQTDASWVHVLPDITLTNPAYNKSLAALCVAQLGIWNHDPGLVQESSQLYGSALRELKKAISCRKQAATEATLASTVILSTYEVSFVAARTRAEFNPSHCSCSQVHRVRFLGGQVTFWVVLGLYSCLGHVYMKLPRAVGFSQTYKLPM